MAPGNRSEFEGGARAVDPAGSIARAPVARRGKENEIELYALAAAQSATRASGKVTALSSRLG